MPVICNSCENAVEDEAEGPPDGQSKLTIAMDLVLRQPWNQKGKGGEVWSGRPGC